MLAPAVIGLSTLAMMQSIGNVAAFNPSILDVQTYDNTHSGGDIRKSVRMGLIFGGSVSLAVGVGASMAARSKWPLVGAVIGLVVIGSAYEWALRHKEEA